MKLTGMMRQQFDAIPHNSLTESVYIVQVKTSLQPYKPLLPLDAYINLTVLPDLSAPEGTTTMALLKSPPRLIPLAFGSEEYEFSSSSVLDNYLRGISLGLTASAPGGAVNTGLQSMLSSLMKTYATDVNGLIVATPMSPNTVQIRLGAMWQGSGERAMIPRSFNGFFALIVPTNTIQSPNPLGLIAKPFFRDPKTGSALRGTTNQDITKKIRKEFCTFNLALKNDCIYAIGEETLSTKTATPILTITITKQSQATTSSSSEDFDDDWFTFFSRIRRNDLTVLACVGINTQHPKPCRENGDAAKLIPADKWIEGVFKPVPVSILEKFVGSLNRAALMERSSYSQIYLPQVVLKSKPNQQSDNK